MENVSCIRKVFNFGSTQLSWILFTWIHRTDFEEKRSLAYNLFRGHQQGLGESLFTRAPLGVTRNNGHKLREGRFRLDIRKNYFTVRVARAWNRLPREVVLSLSLEIFRRRLDRHLAGVLSSLPSLVLIPAHGRGSDSMICLGPLRFIGFMILWILWF